MRPLSSIETTASSASSTIDRVRASLARSVLGDLSVGDVEQVALGLGRNPPRVTDRDGGVPNPDDTAVASQHPVFLEEGLGVRVRAQDLGEHTVPVVGVQDLDEELGVGLPLVDRVSD